MEKREAIWRYDICNKTNILEKDYAYLIQELDLNVPSFKFMQLIAICTSLSKDKDVIAIDLCETAVGFAGREILLNSKDEPSKDWEYRIWFLQKESYKT